LENLESFERRHDCARDRASNAPRHERRDDWFCKALAGIVEEGIERRRGFGVARCHDGRERHGVVTNVVVVGRSDEGNQKIAIAPSGSVSSSLFAGLETMQSETSKNGLMSMPLACDSPRRISALQQARMPDLLLSIHTREDSRTSYLAYFITSEPPELSWCHLKL
jgi:hypothetical protein